MRIENHPVYLDCQKFMNTRGLRVARRMLRRCDAMIIKAAADRGRVLPEKIRMLMVYESELAAQDRRNAIFNIPTDLL